MGLSEILNLLAQAPEDQLSELEELIAPSLEDRVWVPNPGPQTEAFYSEADEVFYGGQAGGGKLLNINTFLPTPSGFVKMGDVQVGDELFDINGEVCRVVAASEITLSKDSYAVTFSDGSVIEADGGHLWHTWTEREREQLRNCTPEWREKRKARRASRAVEDSKKPWVSKSVTEGNRNRVYDIKRPTGSVRTTEEIRSTLRTPNKRAALNHSVEVAKPLRLPDAELPVEPYLLGLWLGDGHSSSPAKIGMLETDWEEILPLVKTPSIRRDEVPIGGTHKQEYTDHQFLGLSVDLHQLGIRGPGKKRIPAMYLRASEEQRKEVLRGLLDTDGHCPPAKGNIEIGLSKEDLMQDVKELVCSLGIQCNITVKRLREKNPNHKDSYKIQFVANFPAFKLQRKLKHQNMNTRPTTQRRYIVSVEPIAPRKMRCVGIDSPTHLYLAGEDMVPTHNTDLEIGLALTEHKRSLILRRTNNEVKGLLDRMRDIVGNDHGLNSQSGVWRRPEDRVIEMGGCQLEADKQKYKGNPHDLICFDEISDFTESQYTFIIAWNRSATPGQRCRILSAGNPPTRPEGLWVVKRWAAWLDPQHPNPAEPGEIRWYTTSDSGEELEVEGPGPHVIEGKPIYARSRTFIPATLGDNPDLIDSGYQASLDALPPELRAAYRDGNFGTTLQDGAYQIIPTAWVIAAQERWTPNPPPGVPMCAMGVDVAVAKDKFVVAPRHDGYYPKPIIVPGHEISDAKKAAGRVIASRYDNAKVIVDVGGGWGADCYAQLAANDIDCIGYMGVKGSNRKSADNRFKFTNVRTEALWGFREALDPSQPGGSTIMLYPSATVRADLCAPSYEVKGTKDSAILKAESKEDVCKRLGRSTDEGDAVIMAWWSGIKQHNFKGGWQGGRADPVVNKGFRADYVTQRRRARNG